MRSAIWVLSTAKYLPPNNVAPLALVVSEKIYDWANSNDSIYLSSNTTLPGRNSFQVKKGENNTYNVVQK